MLAIRRRLVRQWRTRTAPRDSPESAVPADQLYDTILEADSHPGNISQRKMAGHGTCSNRVTKRTPSALALRSYARRRIAAPEGEAGVPRMGGPCNGRKPESRRTPDV